MRKEPGYAYAVKYLTVLAICVLAFSIRLFSVIKYESVIHEFDPYFNYRVTQFLTKEGGYSLWNWFDDRTWYPLGRVIGGTVYPGLIVTAGTIYRLLHALNIPIHVQEVCVFTAPIFSAFCALTTYGLVKEARSDGAGLLAASFVATVPSYISRSVAGSFDNEGVAIFALVNVFNMFIKTVNTGSLFWSTMTVLAYFYMVLSWGGYSFVINLLPIYCLVSIFSGRLTPRLYVAFSPVVVIGTLMACSIPVVGFNAILMSEHFAAFLACAVLHAALLVQFVRSKLTPKQLSYVLYLTLCGGVAVAAVVFMAVIGYVIRSPTYGWTGRSLSLLDPTYASKYIPIIASVSEHQPTSWPSYLNDLHLLAILAPAGIISCFRKFSDGALFLVLYGVTAAYFSGVMVRLMLVLAPAVACLAGVGVSEVLAYLTASLKNSNAIHYEVEDVPEGEEAESETKAVEGKSKEGKKAGGQDRKDKAASGDSNKEKKGDKKEKKKAAAADTGRTYPIDGKIAMAGIFMLTIGLIFFTVHCIYVSAEMYSAPSIVIQTHTQHGTYVFDDFREAYAWLRHNTHPEAKVASWWDYGYQTTAMANRTVIVDNNTWNNTHIATVGRAMSSPEAKAWRIYRSLDVEYVFVVFGGLVGYPSDDINKFLWMVRIGGGVFPEIKEKDYLTNGDYTVAQGASPTMLNSLMYKLSYHEFADASQMSFGRRGEDRVRNYVIGKTNVNLKYFEEVFTSQHWMMRIYRVREKPLRDSVKKSRKRAASS